MKVAILVDVVARDGRNAVEVRQAVELGEGYVANTKGTVYSCAYNSQAGRIAAHCRAAIFCKESGYTVVHIRNCEGNQRAAWQ